MDQLRADFRAADGADGHDQTQAKIDISERAVAFRRHHRFADDVGEIGADREVPIQTDQAQRRTGDKAAAHSEKSTQDADEKSDDGQINRTDVRAGDRKKHGLLGAPANHAQQKCGQAFENDGLADDEKNRRARVSGPVMELKLLQPIPQKMKHEKKIPDDERGIDHQLDDKCAQGFGCVVFHAPVNYSSPLVSLPVSRQGGKANIHCAFGVSF